MRDYVTVNEQAKQILQKAKADLDVLANQFAKKVIHPFCDKYGLIFWQIFDWNFGFIDAAKTGKYPYALDLALVNWVKTKQDPYDDILAEYLKYESSLSQLSEEFLEELEDILKVIDVCPFIDLPQCLGRYIPTYPINSFEELYEAA
jgi:hypothetical protein